MPALRRCAHAPITHGAGALEPGPPFFDALAVLVAPGKATLAADALALVIRGRVRPTGGREHRAGQV